MLFSCCVNGLLNLLPKVLEITSELDKAENYEKELVQKEKEVIKFYKEP